MASATVYLFFDSQRFNARIENIIDDYVMTEEEKEAEIQHVVQHETMDFMQVKQHLEIGNGNE